MSRGTLRIYLGASPGVGKTYAMLSEGQRRAARGTDVVIGYVETHGRPHTAAQVGGLEVIPRQTVSYRGATLEEMDVEAILARKPAVVLVDEYAHTNAPGARHEKRWEDVEHILDAGIDVISTLNIQHLESLNDVVFRITGVQQRETVPDAIVRRAEQIDLVDMSPEAIRRRMAHGNIYPPEKVDAALANYFRPGNLGALRELALLWLADRVEESLADYLVAHGIDKPWETRERIVVCLSGEDGGEAVIRRAARMAGRSRGELIGVFITEDNGLARVDSKHLDQQRRLVTELGGKCYEAVGHDSAETLVEFARREKATQIVLGAMHQSRFEELMRGSVVGRIARLVDDIDVHVIATSGDTLRARAGRGLPVARRRLVAAWVLLLAGLPLLTVGLVAVRQHTNLSTQLLLELVVVLAIAALGGVWIALLAAVVASLLTNWFLVPPHHTFTIAQPENIVALVIFVAVAAAVGFLVDLTARRATEARRARLEARALARSTASLVADPNPLPDLIDQIRATFGLDAVQLVDRDDGDTLAAAGTAASQPTVLEVTGDHGVSAELRLFGSLSADDTRLLRILADQLGLAIGSQRLANEARTAAELTEIDSVRTGMLRSVSHDLRTPLASIKAMVSGLLDPGVSFSADQVHQALLTVNEETDRLNHLVTNLLDASRLQAGTIAVHLDSVPIADVIDAAVHSSAVASNTVDLSDVGQSLLAWCDPILLERALANVIANAVRHQPDEARVRVEAVPIGEHTVIRVIDRGPGIPLTERRRVIEPFQRRDDSSNASGVGLGLAITEGFVEAMGGTVLLDDTPGGGLTVTITLAAQEPLG